MTEICSSLWPAHSTISPSWVGSSYRSSGRIWQSRITFNIQWIQAVHSWVTSCTLLYFFSLPSESPVYHMNHGSRACYCWTFLRIFLTPQVSHYFSLSWKGLSIPTLLRRIRLILNFSLSFASLSSLYYHLSEFYLSTSIVNVYWTPTVLKILCKMWLRIPGNIKGITWVAKHKQVQKVHSIF